jgi:citrate lyase subunit beta/citryl-CoA lyase
MHPIRHRSALFMPASNARALEKARNLDCDIVIIDLEDAVAPDRKAEARAAALAAVTAGGFGARPCVVRANAPATATGAADIAALAGSAVDAVLLPKVDGVADLAAARALLGPAIPLWAMIETAKGIVALPAIVDAAADLGLAALVAGTNDLALDLRARVDDHRTALLPHLAAIVAAARAGGMIALDGVLNAIDDPDRLARDCAQGRAWGFDGKTLIHPKQIAAANAAFGPDATEIEWAERVVALFSDLAHANRGAVRMDGAMVERLHLAEAERILALAGRA